MCDFCKSEELKPREIFRGTLVSIILSRSPVYTWHLLFIPHRHIRYVHELLLEELLEIQQLQRNLFEALKTRHGHDGYNFFSNNGASAGQHIPHAHFHYFSRSTDEKANPYVLLNQWKKQKFTTEEYTKILHELRSLFV